MTTHFWLRAETKKFERRTPIPPTTARALLDAGFALTVEEDEDRIFPLDAYSGCTTAAAGSWRDAPGDAVIVGLKELPEDTGPLRHRHILFAHAFKGQRGWREVLRRFGDGGGTLLDLEFLTDQEGRRVAAFGYWAGYVGAVLGVQHWGERQRGSALTLEAPYSFEDRTALEARARELPTPPTAMVMGALGRSGRGAMDALAALGVGTRTGWDKEETKDGGPFDAILEHALFVNCVLLGLPIPPFVTDEQLLSHPEKSLSVISDVSCDPTSPHNPIPIYDAITTVEAPVVAGRGHVDVIAIDHLPSLLPRESSEDFGSQLLPHLLDFEQDSNETWTRARALFEQKLAEAGS